MKRKYITKADLFVVLHYLGYIMQGLGVVLLAPILVALVYGEYIKVSAFLIPCFTSFVIGTYFTNKFKGYNKLRLKHGMLISSFAWLWASLIGASIMALSLDIHFVDALFENMSAWTGSGMTFFVNVEILPKSILFLRSLEQWIGGLGIVIIFIGILIRSGTAAARLYKSEAREEKIKPNIANTLRKALEIYLIYTALGIFLFILAGLPIFDSINLTFTSISTGGMSIKNANVGFYQNDLVYIISMFLMIVGATSFTIHYRIAKTKGKALLKDVQFQLMISLIILASAIILVTNKMVPIEEIFTVISAITTTGANVVPAHELATWKSSSLIILMVLMVIGGSSGSTVGGMKLIRVITVLKGMNLTVTNLVSPEGRVVSTRIGGKKINEREIKEASGYMVIFFMFLVFGWLVMTLYGYDPFTALFDVVSLISNNGLSTGIVFGGLPLPVKLTLIFLMWIGRLEIIPVLVVFRTIGGLISPRRIKNSMRNGHNE
ncbi:TrkH family potassium uptake protein [Methanobrevibacter sp.]|uniref:TrkH family potassium uptake protein n=1 Tax=Methanobrevibacter sp. TaxID=66852 RepID=UPI0025D29207|nr:TrkH family potassium uptake protein [Methanobrevibacter sp.]MBQ2962457.1 TrkH family potassium uptake protein [Methanobrevibacter sp.]